MEERQLIQGKFFFYDLTFYCWAIKIDYVLWFKAHDIAVLLDYKDCDDAVRCYVPHEQRKQWNELRVDGVQTPTNWQPNTVFISKGGLYRLFCRSTKLEGIRFERWLFDHVLPTPRLTPRLQCVFYKNLLINYVRKWL